MERVVKIISLNDRSTDFAFWCGKTDLERLEAIELLRLQYIKFKSDVEPGFQRVCRIINKK